MVQEGKRSWMREMLGMRGDLVWKTGGAGDVCAGLDWPNKLGITSRTRDSDMGMPQAGIASDRR